MKLFTRRKAKTRQVKKIKDNDDVDAVDAQKEHQARIDTLREQRKKQIEEGN